MAVRAAVVAAQAPPAPQSAETRCARLRKLAGSVMPWLLTLT